MTASLPRPELAKKLSSLHAHFSPPCANKEKEANNNNSKMEAADTARLQAPSRGGRPNTAGHHPWADWCGGSSSSCFAFFYPKNDEPPEITYCVVDGAGTLSVQAVAPALPMPESEEELDKKFNELVVSSYILHFKFKFHKR